MSRGQSLCKNYVIDTASGAALAENGGAFLEMDVHNFNIMRFRTGSEVHRVFSHVTTYGSVKAPALSAMTNLPSSMAFPASSGVWLKCLL